MNLKKICLAVLLMGLVGACSKIDIVTRAAPKASPVEAQKAVVMSSDWTVDDVRVNVPKSLKVSEANRYYPIADIVWRGDSFGDRHAQVEAIMDSAMTQGVKHLNGAQNVVMDVEVHRFHSLTEKARYSLGGIHQIIYTMAVKDAATGEVLQGPTKHQIDLKAYGGEQAFEAERRGETQKRRITQHLINKTREKFPGQAFTVTRNDRPAAGAVTPAVTRDAAPVMMPIARPERVTRELPVGILMPGSVY